MTFERYMDRQFGKEWGVTMAAHVKWMKDAWLAGRMDAFREVENGQARRRHQEESLDD